MRDLFLRDTPLDREGTLPPGYRGGGKWFCPSCGELWASVRLPGLDWMAVTAICPAHRITPRRFLSAPGSLLPGLSFLTGASISGILNSSGPDLLHHEALMHAEWIISRHEMP